MVTAEKVDENDLIIEQLLMKGSPAPEPGDFMQDRVIHKGDEEAPAPVLASSVTSAGYVLVYDTLTREASSVNRDLLPLHLRKLHPDGTRAFTLAPPSTPPARGTLKCLLHQDGPSRKEYDRIGFKVCPKQNLMTEFDVEGHMKARHKKEWATIEAARVRREREEDRAYQRQMMKALGATAKARPSKAKSDTA